MYSDFERQRSTTLAASEPPPSVGTVVDDDAMDSAAAALRKAEIAAALPDLHSLDESQIVQMTIDELRAVAGALNVPHRAQITEQDELIEAILRHL